MTTTSFENIINYIKDSNNKFIETYCGYGKLKIKDLVLYLTEDRKKLGVRHLHAAFNPVVNADGCANSWWKTILKSKGFDKVLTYEHCSVYGYTDYYVEITDVNLAFLAALTRRASILNFFYFNPDWDLINDDGSAEMYLIVVPKHNGKHIVKWGKTVCLIYRFRLYLNGVDEELRKLGIIILALGSVENSSKAEHSLTSEFTEDEACRKVEGNEYYKITEDYPECPWWETAQMLFDGALFALNNKKTRYENYDFGTNVFRLNKDMDKYGYKDMFKPLNLEK